MERNDGGPQRSSAREIRASATVRSAAAAPRSAAFVASSARAAARSATTSAATTPPAARRLAATTAQSHPSRTRPTGRATADVRRLEEDLLPSQRAAAQSLGRGRRGWRRVTGNGMATLPESRETQLITARARARRTGAPPAGECRAATPIAQPKRPVTVRLTITPSRGGGNGDTTTCHL